MPLSRILCPGLSLAHGALQFFSPSPGFAGIPHDEHSALDGLGATGAGVLTSQPSARVSEVGERDLPPRTLRVKFLRLKDRREDEGLSASSVSPICAGSAPAQGAGPKAADSRELAGYLTGCCSRCGGAHVTVAFLDRLPGEVEPDGEGVPRLDGGVALGLCVQESSQPVRAGLLVRYFLSNACRQRIFTSSEARGNCGPDPRNR